jgi:hypothetical protein
VGDDPYFQLLLWVVVCAAVVFPALLASWAFFTLLGGVPDRERGARGGALIYLVIALVLWGVFLFPFMRFSAALERLI